MKINTLRKDEQSAGKNLQHWDDLKGSDIEMDAKSCWILSILGALSMGVILLASELIK
jgi:hypothetical protein